MVATKIRVEFESGKIKEENQAVVTMYNFQNLLFFSEIGSFCDFVNLLTMLFSHFLYETGCFWSRSVRFGPGVASRRIRG